MSVLLELLNTSLLVGALHTLAAPNLAALATLSGIDILNQSENDVDDYRNKQRRNGGSFFLGMQWGLGNAFGILFVGAIVVILQTGDPRGDWEWMDDWLRIVMQAFVGVFLLILGIYGLVKALRNRELNTLDLQFKKSVADAESNYSVGIGSAITEIVVNHVDLEELSEGSAKSARRNPVMMRRASTKGEDSIVQKMTTCLRDDVRNGDALEETLGLSEYEITMWRAAKNVSSSIAMYADEDYSTSSKSLANTNLSSSFTTVKSEWADMLKEGYLDGTPDEEEDVEVVKTKDANSIRTGSDTSSRQSSKFLLRKMSKCGNCLYCTPGLLAFFAGLVYGLSGPGDILALMPAAKLEQVHLAVLYVAMFCVSSTVVMGLFSSVYRSICKKIVERAGKRDDRDSFGRAFLIECGSAFLSLVVGIVWITLLAVGELDVIAP